jgi:hypothetical protein
MWDKLTATLLHIDKAKNYPEIGRSLHPKPVPDQYSKSRGESMIVALGKEPGKDPIQMMSTNWNTKFPWTERSRVPGLQAVMNGASQ